ncbi:MAG: acylphosphatase, partial [Euryarchaeota archaeon]|nr:acylphosphatase [Euryarchaeota archaeon]
MPAVRKRLIISGNVQDVAYRAFVKFIARRLGLAGFARNLDDGTVEVVCEGDEQAVK